MPHDDRQAPNGAPAPSSHSGVHPDHEPAFGARWWEHHYQQRDTTSPGAPSPYLVDELASLTPGTALDAGCGTGADAIWLARHGWNVTAVDIAPTAIAQAREHAARAAADVAHHIAWIVADLASWAIPRRYDLVLSQYVHPDTPFDEFITRLAAAVAPGGTLMVVGHDHADSHSTAHAPSDPSIGTGEISDILDPNQWKIEIAETRPRQATHVSDQLTIVDTVIKARRASFRLPSQP